MNRWWQYQKERFPLAQHGLLIAVFSFCAVSFSAQLRGGGFDLRAFLLAMPISLITFLHLRIADEFKDAEEDRRWRPYRAVPRGLVSLGELRKWWIGTAIVQWAIVLFVEPRLSWLLGITWLYLGLMSVEFFCRDWLKARPVVYLVSHMAIMPLVDLFATACDWMPRGLQPYRGLYLFLLVSFCNGLVIELGRKIRAPEDEEPGVETYSALWGSKRAVKVWVGCALLTSMLAMAAASAVGLVPRISLIMTIAFFGVLGTAMAFLRETSSRRARAVERMSGIFTLVLYGGLGSGCWRLGGVL